MFSMMLRVRIYAGEDGYVIAECPALPGCITQGKTRDEALANVREAIEGWLEVQQDRSGSPPTGQVEIVDLAV